MVRLTHGHSGHEAGGPEHQGSVQGVGVMTGVHVVAARGTALRWMNKAGCDRQVE